MVTFDSRNHKCDSRGLKATGKWDELNETWKLGQSKTAAEHNENEYITEHKPDIASVQ